jgi:excisionase family DNA binding protein
VTDRLLEAREVAERLSVPPTWPLEQARAGNIPHLKLGRYTRFDWPEVVEWLESLKAGGGPAFRKHRPQVERVATGGPITNDRDGC